MQAYQESVADSASSPAPGKPDSLEPLYDYLKPQFGNVYEYDGLEKPAWNDELQQAVKRYLVEELSDDLFEKTINYLGHLPPEASRAEQAKYVTKKNFAFDIAMAVHNAIVESLPSLDALIGGLDSWDGHMELVYDAGTWLTANISEKQLASMSDYLGTKPIEWELDRYALDGSISPRRLLDAWRLFGEYRAVDLTDDEWRLLKQFIPERASWRSTEEQTRKVIDGMAYRFTHDVPWSNVPERYGSSTNLRQRWYYTYRHGVFPQALEALRGNPKAARLVAWLEKATAGDSRETDYNRQHKEIKT